MIELEVKQMLIDHYINLLRIKAANDGHENAELDFQLETIKEKLGTFAFDTGKLENMILK